jgi:hypothetical protein
VNRLTKETKREEKQRINNGASERSLTHYRPVHTLLFHRAFGEKVQKKKRNQENERSLSPLGMLCNEA